MAKENFQKSEKTYVFIVVYVLMVVLWILGHLMAKETPIKRIDTLNSFECPVNGNRDNQYDCKRFDLEKNPHYAFFFENDLPLFDLDISIRIYRQTGIGFNEARTEKIKATLYKLELDSSRKVVKKEAEKTYNFEFECKANQWVCGPLNVLSDSSYPIGKHHFLLEFEKPDILFQTVKHIELYTEYFEQDYQRYVIWVKTGMILLTLIGTSLYYLRLKKLDKTYWSSEQIWILFLSGAVICINDPLLLLYQRFGISILMFVSQLAIVAGLSLLVPFWIASLRSIRLKVQSRFLVLPEVIFTSINLALAAICTLFVPAEPSLIFSLWKGVNYIGAAWIILSIVQNLRNLSKLLWIDKVFMMVTLYFAAAYFGLIYQWETPIDIYDRNYSKVLALIYLFTIYSLICQYLYVPREGDQITGEISTPDKRPYGQLQEEIERSDLESEV